MGLNVSDALVAIQPVFNGLTVVACTLLAAEYILVVRVRKPPYPWSSYAVAFVMFALACERLLALAEPQKHLSLWQLSSRSLLDLVVFAAALLIPVVRKATYRRPRFDQLKAVHEDLKHSQDLFRRYLDESPMVAYIKDKDRRVTHVNEGYVRFFGESAESALGKTNLWGDAGAAQARDEQILAGQGRTEVVETLPLKESTRTILDIRFPLVGPDRERMLGGIAIDLTSQLVRKNRIEVLASIVELSPEAIYSLDEKGTVQTWNPAAERLFGYSSEEMIGQSITRVFPPDRVDELTSLIGGFKKDQRSIHQLESVRVCKDGSHRDVFFAAACVRGGEPSGMTIAVISRDITERKKAEMQKRVLHDELESKVKELSLTNARLQQSRDEALESASMKSAFVANISHELRTPLSGILGMSELLSRQHLDEDAQSLIAMLRESAQALLRVVEDVLDLAKLEAGKTVVEPELFSIREQMRHCAEMFASACAGKGLSWQTVVDDAVPEQVCADPAIVKQALCSLVSNAVQFTESGGITLAVSMLEDASSGSEIKISVSDTGKGIEDDDLHLLFTPFARVSQSTDGTSGTGLGLVLCQKLVTLMGGQMGCTSKKNDGSTFWFTVPCTDRGDLRDGRAESPELPLLTPEELSRFHVLSVDDSPVVSKLTMRQLAIIGVQCEAATTGKEAIEKALAEHFDAILLDVHLPDMTGYEVAREIRRSQASAGKPRPAIIALTGEVPAALQNHEDIAVMDDFLEKPITIDLLRARLSRALLPLRSCLDAGDDAGSLAMPQ